MKAIELRQKRAQLIADMGKITEKAHTENRAFSPEEKESFERMFADEKELRSTIESIEAQEGLQRSIEETTETRARQAHNQGQLTADQAFERYIRSAGNVDTETRSLLVREQRVDGVGNTTATSGTGHFGYIVPQGFGGMIIEAMKYVGGPLNVANVIGTDNGAPLPYPVLDDTSNDSDVVAENAAISTVDLVDGQLLLNAWKYPAQAKLSIELLQDNGVNIQAKLADILGKRIARGVNRDMTVGDGSSKCKGFLKSATAVVGSSATAIAYTDLVKLKYSVDRSYRENGTWQMNDVSFQVLVTMADDQNRPLIFPATNGASEVLFGQAVTINPAMPDPTSTTTVKAAPIAYGDFKQYYVRQVNGVVFRVLTELFAGNDMVGFRATQRVDGKLAIASAVKFLEQPLAS
jgi:HK97 family phage major capsid protein